MECRRLVLLDDAEPAVPACRVQDPPVPEPERDVIHGISVCHQVARPGLGDLLAGLVLLPRIPRDDPPRQPVRHVDEPGAVDTSGGHASPLVPRPEVGSREVERRVAGEMLATDPAGIAVGGADTRPAPQPLFDLERLAAQRLSHLLGGLVGRCTKRGNVSCASHGACLAIFSSSIAFTRGQSSSTIEYQAESRIESGRIMCFRKIPSNVAPTPSSAPRTRRLRASVLNSTRIAPHPSKALRSSRYFASTFEPFPHCERSSHVQPISTRLCIGSTLRYRDDPTGSPPAITTNGTSRSDSSAMSNHRSKPNVAMLV